MLRVFLVENEGMIREALRDTVPWTQCGYTVVGEAGDGGMALPMIRQTKPDVLITDIRMPNMDGLALSRLVRQEFPQMKVILTGHADFEYARQAIDIGVERYLLKPVTKSTLLSALNAVSVKLEGERARPNDIPRDYGQYVRRDFFEQLVTGRLPVRQIYEQAEKLELDLRAQAYTIALVSAVPELPGLAESYSEPRARIRDGLVAHFLKYPEYILFRWDLSTYAVLIKGDSDSMEHYIRRCIRAVQEQYETNGSGLSWYAAVGKPTQRLGDLPVCFEEVSRLWAYRHIFPSQHILMENTVSFLTGTGSEYDLAELDVSRLNPAVVTGVLQNSGVQDVPGFVDEYIHSLEPALGSKPFCQYLMLSIRFTATEFVGTLGISRKAYLSALNCLDMVGQNVTVDDLKQYISDILHRAIALRDRAAGSQYRSLLKDAVSYIDANFQSGDISLHRVAQAVNVSANYLSAVFSQELGSTFVEYLTAKRMEKARELLRTSNLRSGEVARAVGYKDPHYFSFLFKKTQGCTPREYRAGTDRK